MLMIILFVIILLIELSISNNSEYTIQITQYSEYLNYLLDNSEYIKLYNINYLFEYLQSKEKFYSIILILLKCNMLL